MRFLFYCHDATGVAHMQHEMTVAGHLVADAPRPSVLFVVGTEAFSRVAVPAGVEVLKVPGLPRPGHASSARRLGIPSLKLVALRASVLETVTVSYHPDVVIVDADPLGPYGEMRPSLEALRAAGRPTVFAIGHIPGDLETAVRERPRAWYQAIDRYYDRVLVSGPRRGLDALRGAAWPSAAAKRIRYCGEVDAPACAAAALLELATDTRVAMTAGHVA